MWEKPGRYFPSLLRQPLSDRFEGLLRLNFYTWCLVALGLLGAATSGRSTAYFLLLWVLPLGTSFSFFMLLRDAYQHTNADDGRLTNTRVFIADPFTRWAVFVYGQDMHLPHHLLPGIPHYRLPLLHRLLKLCRPGEDTCCSTSYRAFLAPRARLVRGASSLGPCPIYEGT